MKYLIRILLLTACSACALGQAKAPATIPDGVKVQFFVANNQLSDANGKLKAMADADPKPSHHQRGERLLSRP